MKISVSIMIAATLELFAVESYSQAGLISVDVKQSTVLQVLNSIEQQSEFYFLYSTRLVDVNREVSLSYKDAPINDVLAVLFEGTNVDYLVLEKQIVLSTRKLLGKSEPIEALQAGQTIKGTVSDVDGAPLQGVTVMVKATTIGTVTDINGIYEIVIPTQEETLIFSFVGMLSQEVSVGEKTRIDIYMQPDLIGMEEVVVVGYGTQKKIATTSSVSAIDGDEISGAPVADVTNGIVGRLPGILSFQASGEPGADETTLRIRGIGTLGNANPLVIIDGIPRSLSTINPTEIETITILKDAAAVAPYGIGGANGVILIKTKRGEQGKFSINYKNYYGIQGPTFMPEYVDAYTYAKTLNIANENIGGVPAYTEDELQKFKDGSDPVHYPNTDMVDEIINFKAPLMRHDLSFSGGSQQVRAYGNLGYLYQEGVVPVINYTQYSLLLNVDADVTKTTTISLDVNGAQSKNKNPDAWAGTGIFLAATEAAPILPYTYPNGLPASWIYPTATGTGMYNINDGNSLNMKLQFDQKIPFISGLNLKGVFNYNIDYTFNKSWSEPRTLYSLSPTDEYIPRRDGPVKPELSESNYFNKDRVVQLLVTYDRSFGDHAITALGVYEGKSGNLHYNSASRINYDLYIEELSFGSSDRNNFDNDGSSSEYAQMGWVYRLGYSYAMKYFVEFSGRYDGHYYFAPEERFAFFPSFSAAWRISEEDFFKDKMSWFNSLKVRGSYGKSGNLAGGPFQYLTSYLTRTGYIFGGTSPVQVLGAYESLQANSLITWENSNKADIGLDAVFLNGKLDLTLDVFYEKRSDMLLDPGTSVPAEYGIGLSQVNAGIMDNRGIDLSLGTRHTLFNDFKLNAVFNLTYAKNELIETFETSATYNNPNRRRTGRPLNTRFGLQALGLYQTDDFDSQGDPISGLPIPTFGTVYPGDIKYADLAGAPGPDGKITGPDGIIDINDYTAIGDPLFPQMIFGLNTIMSWKGFDLTMLWQGASKGSLYTSVEMAMPFHNGAKPYKEMLDYWTPENTDATRPRLTPAATAHNKMPSSFWVKDNTYLRLKTLQFGYTIPSNLTNRITMKSLKVFVSGQNLLTLCKVRYIDPELTSDRARYYFQQKVYACGIIVNF